MRRAPRRLLTEVEPRGAVGGRHPHARARPGAVARRQPRLRRQKPWYRRRARAIGGHHGREVADLSKCRRRTYPGPLAPAWRECAPQGKPSPLLMRRHELPRRRSHRHLRRSPLSCSEAASQSPLRRVFLPSRMLKQSQDAKKGPDARRRPMAAREAYSLYVERAAEGAKEADGPFSASC